MQHGSAVIGCQALYAFFFELFIFFAQTGFRHTDATLPAAMIGKTSARYFGNPMFLLEIQSIQSPFLGFRFDIGSVGEAHHDSQRKLI